MLLLSILNTAWMPRFFGITDEAERRSVLAASRDALYRLMVPIVIGFAVGTPLVLKVWPPASYHPEKLALVVSIVLITAIPYAGQLAVTRALMAAGSTKAAAGVTLAAAAVNLSLNLIMVPRLGLTGSALATFAAYAFLYGILAIVGRRLRIPSSPRTLRLELAAAITLALLSAAVPENTPDPDLAGPRRRSHRRLVPAPLRRHPEVPRPHTGALEQPDPGDRPHLPPTGRTRRRVDPPDVRPRDPVEVRPRDPVAGDRAGHGRGRLPVGAGGSNQRGAHLGQPYLMLV